MGLIYEAFLWARRALKHQNHRLPAWAVMANKTHDDVGSFRLGDSAVWLKSDEDIPDGTLGTSTRR